MRFNELLDKAANPVFAYRKVIFTGSIDSLNCLIIKIME